MISDASLSASLRLAPGIITSLTALVLVIEGDGVLSAPLQQLRGPRELSRHRPQLGGELGPGPGERGLGGEMGEGGAGLPRLLPVELMGATPVAQSTLIMELRMVRGGWKQFAGLRPNMRVTRVWSEVTGVT